MILAWHGSQELKDAALKSIQEHRRLDLIIRGGGDYWQGGKGCHLGCLTHSDEDPHKETERMFGLPERVAHWLESVFEGLPQEEASQWFEDSAAAIPVGADLALAHHHLAAWLLGPDSPSAAGNQHELTRESIAVVRELHKRAASGETIDDATWSEARSAAWLAESAAWSEAESVEWLDRSATWSVARSVARSAWSAAASATWSARSATWSEARSMTWSVESTTWSAWSAWSTWSVRPVTWSVESAVESTVKSAAWRSIAAKSLEIFAAAPVCEAEAIDTSETLAFLRQPLVAV